MPDPHLRAADADRAAVAAQLGEHMAAGRLRVDEYDDRLARAYAARTYGELAELTADLPRPVARQTGPAASTPAPWAHHGIAHAGSWGGWSGGPSRYAAWRNWLATAVIVLTVWIATSIGSGELLYPWPIWVIGPWGAVLLAQTIASNRRDDDEHRRLT
ncbi:DUF1707 SHOCT-like domain-containing protein [Geodermatophilus sabuli]|uniref:DUF1707 domain-containing protein n=1 Tax=Geodermatophilus sabuli TaxID=1564158 RepID=A0A285EHJ0_9ACTN|nr:DUF1707 domain-containing protein [Geodermatophilus sabuli]MBB3086303.1 hypothetical protein [Geodermatophilus sabuli]SNX97481.1 protein of unknown function [Geodermatophilus sabuli]